MALTADPADQALLLDLQAFDTRLEQLGHRAARLPENVELAGLAERTQGLHRDLAAHRGRAEDAAAELARVESDAAVVRARIDRDTARLQGSSSVKDIQGLEHELAALARRAGDLDDIQLAVMEAQEARDAEAAAAREKLSGLEVREQELRARRDASADTIAGERLDALAARESLVARIPADLLDLYERQRSRYGAGASLLRGRVSSASGVELTGSDLTTVRQAAPEDVLLCPDSNAILVRTAESGL